jgi:hypothetical protein
MRFRQRLEFFAIPNLSLYLVVGQLAVLGLALTQRLDERDLVLVGVNVLHGE